MTTIPNTSPCDGPTILPAIGLLIPCTPGCTTCRDQAEEVPC